MTTPRGTLGQTRATWLRLHRASQAQGRPDRTPELRAESMKYADVELRTMQRVSVLVDTGPRDWRRGTYDVTLPRITFAFRWSVEAWEWGRP